MSVGKPVLLNESLCTFARHIQANIGELSCPSTPLSIRHNQVTVSFGVISPVETIECRYVPRRGALSDARTSSAGSIEPLQVRLADLLVFVLAVRKFPGSLQSSCSLCCNPATGGMILRFSTEALNLLALTS